MRARLPAGERGGKRSDRNFRTRVPRAHTMVVKQINSAGVVGGCTTQNAWEYVIGTGQWRYLYTRLCVFISTLLGAHISTAALPATSRVHTSLLLLVQSLLLSPLPLLWARSEQKSRCASPCVTAPCRRSVAARTVQRHQQRSACTLTATPNNTYLAATTTTRRQQPWTRSTPKRLRRRCASTPSTWVWTRTRTPTSCGWRRRR